MPLCVTCHCKVRRRKNKCMNCFLVPPKPGDVWEEERCVDCDDLLCLLHASEEQLRHGLCKDCFVERAANDDGHSSSEEEGVLLDAPFQEEEWWHHAYQENEENEQDEECVRGKKRARITLCSHPGGHDLDDCSICHEAMGQNTLVLTLPCFGNHVFHTRCITHWFDTQRHTCPLCNDQVHVHIDSH